MDRSAWTGYRAAHQKVAQILMRELVKTTKPANTSMLMMLRTDKGIDPITGFIFP
jgi:hypothetical protein